MFQLFGKYRDMALAVKNPCHLNIAACLIKLKRFDEAIAQCSIVCYSTMPMNNSVFNSRFTFMRVHFCSLHRPSKKLYMIVCSDSKSMSFFKK